MRIVFKEILLVIFIFLMLDGAVSAQKIITLESARQMALEKNNQLKIAQKNIEAARATKIGANAPMYPGISVSTTGFYFGKPISDLVPGYGAAVTLGINQSIYSGGKTKLGIAAAQKELDIQEIQKAVTTSEILINVEKSYWQIVKLNKKLDLLISHKALLQTLLRDLNNSFEAGTLYKNDVLRAQVQLNNADLDIFKVKDSLAIAKLSLAQIIGFDPNESFDINDSLSGVFSIIVESSTGIADKRPEINLLGKVIDRQNLQINLLRSDFKPTIGLNINGVTSAGKKGINFGNPESNFLTSYYGLLSISVPIWDGGATRQKIKAQMFSVSAQQLQLEDTKQLISIEIQNAQLQLNQAVKRIELSNFSIVQAEENLRLSNDRFKAGTIVSKDVIEAQNIWEQANSDSIDAKIQYKISEALLKKALGTLN